MLCRTSAPQVRQPSRPPAPMMGLTLESVGAMCLALLPRPAAVEKRMLLMAPGHPAVLRRHGNELLGMIRHEMWRGRSGLD